MANQKLTDLADAGALSPADMLYIVQGSNSRKIAVDDFFTGYTGSIGITGSTGGTGGTGGVGSTGATGSFALINESAADPLISDVATGASAIWKNTISGDVKLWVNDNGTMKSVTLT